MTRRKKTFWITLMVLVAVGAGFFAVWFYYPFGEGIRTGELNYVVYKGVLFKTYEGKMIQSGFRSTASRTGSGIGSNEFIFSVRDSGVADTLMRMGGSEVELHYTEYFGALPWRGHSKYIVDKILSVRPRYRQDVLPPAEMPVN